MKKEFLLFIICVSLFTSLHAQRFKAGALAGIVTSQVDGDTYAGYNKAGMLVGGFVASKFSDVSKWSVSFEITYIQKGSRKTPHPDKGDFADYKLKLNYVEVPLLVKYDVGRVIDTSGLRGMHFTFIGGVAIGTLIYSAEWDAFGPLSGGTPFQKKDVPVILGLNYSFSKHIGFDVRTEYSLFPVRKGGTSSYYQNWTSNFFKPGYYNNLIIFLFRYRI